MFVDREISLLKFNERVLEEAVYKHNPLLERINFLGIVSKNIDEFYKTRFHKINEEKLNDNLVKEINNHVNRIMLKKNKTYKILLSNLKKNNIIIQNSNIADIRVNEEELIDEDLQTNIKYFTADESFKNLICGEIYICFQIEDEENTRKFAVYSINNSNRLIRINSVDENFRYVLREHLAMERMKKHFGNRVFSKCIFKITRDSSLIFKDFNKDNYLSFIEKSVRKRLNGTILRLEIYKNDNEIILNHLKDKFQLDDNNIFQREIPIDLSFLMELKKDVDNISLKFNDFKSKSPKELKRDENLFEVLRRKDIFLHHPYDSFDVLLNMLDRAVKDPDVVSIKQTVYRVSSNSPIVRKLIEASERGIKVTVLLELRARFDEDNNILCAKKLEESGCNVIYGVKGLKTHAKVLMITKLTDGQLERFFHVSTGNYNEVTAKLYTDMALISSNKKLARDISKFFNMITGVSEYVAMEKVFISPITMRDEFEHLIKREIKNVEKGYKGKIIAKFNSLEDKKLIKLLYRAASKGVKVKLIVRGICCLKITDDIKGNIEVRSIVGRFLEHSRIYSFYNNGNEKIFISSADLMERNLDRRIELLIPILDEEIKHKIKDILKIYLKDNSKAWILNEDGEYFKAKVKKKIELNSQEYHLLKNEHKVSKLDDIESFMPLKSSNG